jgi:Uma2 family endonuclease
MIVASLPNAGSYVSVEEYLRTPYQPDCEYEDGAVLERNVGEIPHSWIQGLLVRYVLNRRRQWNAIALPEQRFKIRERKYMIPDVCVLEGSARPTVPVLILPPLVWIEILSSEDRPIRVNRKVKDALAFGAPRVWVIDPETLENYVATPKEQVELPDGVLSVPGTEITIPLQQLEED